MSICLITGFVVGLEYSTAISLSMEDPNDEYDVTIIKLKLGFIEILFIVK